MLHIKPKKFPLLVFFCVISGLFCPALTQADSVNAWGGDSGAIDAGKAAAQREAAAKRAAKKQKRAEEKKAAETHQAAESQKEKAVAK
jgi:hypothetical protein